MARVPRWMWLLPLIVGLWGYGSIVAFNMLGFLIEADPSWVVAAIWAATLNVAISAVIILDGESV